MILTINEKKVLRLLAANQEQKYSINQIAKYCSLSPNGSYKILKKLSKERILKCTAIANIKAYSLDFGSEKTLRILELSLMPEELEGKIKLRADDLLPLKEFTQCCILFGSYITSKKKPNDLDVLFIVEKENYLKFKQLLEKIKDIIPIKVHEVVQTRDDFIQNLQKNDPIITASLQKGIILWGYETIAGVIKNAAR